MRKMQQNAAFSQVYQQLTPYRFKIIIKYNYNYNKIIIKLNKYLLSLYS